jgi:2,5-dioxopentanoate dehydrogenase
LALEAGGPQTMLTDGIAKTYRDGKRQFEIRNSVKPVYVTDSKGRQSSPNH